MKKIPLYLAFLLLHFNVTAQEIEWQNTFGGNDFDLVRSIGATSDGGVICGIFSKSNISGDKTENSQGGVDYWIVKLDSSGNIHWQNSIGGGSTDEIRSISQTSDGGFICGGTSISNISGDKTESGLGGYDFWILKLDASGNIQWQNTIGGSSTDFLYSISQTSDGGYICGGSSNSDISGDKTENSMGQQDFWIIKLDVSGNIQWQNTIGGSGIEELHSIIQTIEGGFICGGYSISGISGDKNEANIGNYDFWVVKTDSVGNIEWQNTLGGTDDEKINSILQTADSSYICGGYSLSDISADKSENSQGSYDFWIVKLSASGNIIWDNTIGGIGDEKLNSITTSVNGGYICGGSLISSISGDVTEFSQGETDYWFIKLDDSGNIEWQNVLGGTGLEHLISIAETTSGGIICGGYSQSDISGDKSENSQGLDDAWIVKLSNKVNLIKGEIFADLNSNNVHDAGEPPLPGLMVTESNTGRIGVSEQNGNFSVAVLDSGIFSVSPTTILPYYSSTPLSHNASFSSFNELDTLNDFAFQPTGVFNDLKVTISPLSLFRPGLNAYYYLQYQNVGTTPLQGTAIFYPDASLTFISASVNPTTITTDSITWQTPILNPFDAGYITITVNVDNTTQIGTTAHSCALIEPVSGDFFPANNNECWDVIVFGPYDPNNILVSRSTLLTTELSNPPFLDYIINFQNIGNDTAFNVRVQNNLPTMLDYTTLELVASSHPVTMSYSQNSRLCTFMFNNIALPDSNVNEPMSHGFARYRIKPNTSLIAGDSIKNKAFIYFDFNQPVATNTAITEIVLPSFVPEIKNNFDFKLYPNPAKNEVVFSVELNENADVEFHLINTLGQIADTRKATFSKGLNEIKYSTQLFPDGVYFMKVSVKGNVSVRKLVISH